MHDDAVVVTAVEHMMIIISNVRASSSFRISSFAAALFLKLKLCNTIFFCFLNENITYHAFYHHQLTLVPLVREHELQNFFLETFAKSNEINSFYRGLVRVE